jgi:hypothetical protein
MKALAVSREQRIERLRCTQSYYSLAGRDLEQELSTRSRRSPARTA